MENILGSLGVGEDQKDFQEEIVGSESADFGGKCFNGYIYNQKLVDNYSCTGQAACQMITSFTGIILPLSFRKKVWERQLETGAIPGQGDYTQNGVKQAVKLFNEIVESDYPEYGKKLEYYRAYIKNKDVRNTIIKNGSPIVLSFKGNLYADSQDNAIIDNPNNADGAGHAVTDVKIYSENGVIKDKYCDNYNGVNEKNIIIVPDFDNNKNFYSMGYYLKSI